MPQPRKSNPPRDPVIPDKLYFRIGEVARLLDVETHTLRFWETEFPQLKVGKGGTGQRLYRRRDVELVVEIKHLLYEQGYTIPGARQYLLQRHHRRDSAAPEPADRAREPGPAAPSLERIRAELRELSKLLSTPFVNNSAHVRDRARPVAATSRRGLHLADRTSGKHPPAPVPARGRPPSSMGDLFDPRSE